MTRLMKSSRVHFAMSSSIRAQWSFADAGAGIGACASLTVVDADVVGAAVAGWAGLTGLVRVVAVAPCPRAAAPLSAPAGRPPAAGSAGALAGADSSTVDVSDAAAALVPLLSSAGLPASTGGNGSAGGSGAALWLAGGGASPEGTLAGACSVPGVSMGPG